MKTEEIRKLPPLSEEQKKALKNLPAGIVWPNEEGELCHYDGNKWIVLNKEIKNE